MELKDLIGGDAFMKAINSDDPASIDAFMKALNSLDISGLVEEYNERNEGFLKMGAEELLSLDDNMLYSALVTRLLHEMDETPDDPLEALQGAKHDLLIADVFSMEMSDGGLHDFFEYHGRDYARYVLPMLRNIGADEHYRLFEGFAGRNGIDLENADSWKDLSEYPFSEYDEAFFETEVPFLDIIVKCCREHIGEF